MQFEEKHRLFSEKLNTSIDELKTLTPDQKECFIFDIPIPYICGKCTKEEEDIADDNIDLIDEEEQK